jgi:hypothetical protein
MAYELRELVLKHQKIMFSKFNQFYRRKYKHAQYQIKINRPIIK